MLTDRPGTAIERASPHLQLRFGAQPAYKRACSWPAFNVKLDENIVKLVTPWFVHALRRIVMDIHD